MADVIGKHGVSERHACKLLGLSRTTYRRDVRERQDFDVWLTEWIRELRLEFPDYGYRRIGAELNHRLKLWGMKVNRKHIERLWAEAGFQLRSMKKKRQRGQRDVGTITGLPALRTNHVWAIDFVEFFTDDNRKFRIMTLIDEHSRFCLKILPRRTFKAIDVMDALTDVILEYGMPEYIRSDNGSEFIATVLNDFLSALGGHHKYTEPGCPYQNGFNESINATVVRELLNRETFATMTEADVKCEDFREFYNNVRLHSSLGYLAPAVWLQRQDSVAVDAPVVDESVADVPVVQASKRRPLVRPKPPRRSSPHRPSMIGARRSGRRDGVGRVGSNVSQEVRCAAGSIAQEACSAL